MKKAIIRLVGLLILVGAGYGVYRFMNQLPERQEQLATAKVLRGDVIIRAFTRGEMKAVRTAPVTAPNLFGTVQVTQLAPMGSLAKEKDLIVEYDDSERLSALEEAQLAVESVDEQIKKLKADLAMQESEDAVVLLKTGYAVRSAELDVQKNPILDAIDGKKNILALDQAKRALKQQQADIEARKVQTASQLAVYQETRSRDLLDVARERQRLALTKSLAPIAGLVAIKQNRGGFFNYGQQQPDIREGDTLQPGMPVAEVLDLSEVEVWAKVGELDRANLKEDQEAMLQLDAIPDKRFHGKVKSLSGTATSDVFSGDPSKKFDVVFSLNMRELLAALGMKPAEVDRVMETAAANAKKGVTSTGPSLFGGGRGAPDGMAGGPPSGQGDMSGGMPSGMAGGMPGGMAGGMSGGMPGASGAEQSQGARAGRGPGGGMANLSEEDRKKLREAMQKAQNATPEERQKIFEQFRQKAGGSQGRGQAPSGASGRSATADAGRGGPGAGTARMFGGQAGTGRAGDNSLQTLMSRFNVSQYSEAERNNARLPLAPDQDSELKVLLRPGLLADIEIVVERIPDALHVPAQAVFQKNGKPTVYVKLKNGKFEARQVQLIKQSESMMVLASGVTPGEIVAMADPTADQSGKKGEKKSQSNGNPMGAVTGGK